MPRLKVSLILLIGCFVCSINGQQSFCQRHSSTPGLRFTDLNGPADLAIGCELLLVDFVCCASNFRKIVWYQSTDKTTWHEFMLIHNKTRKVTDGGQVASITELHRQTDSGYYKCVAHGYNDETIENVAVIDIRNCSLWSEPPKPLNPHSDLSYFEVSPGDSIDIMCSSFSGVNCEEKICVYGWYKQLIPFDDSSHMEIPHPDQANSSIRVQFTKSYIRNGLRMESVLSIANVTADDYNVAFVCYAGTLLGSPDNRVVRLTPYARETKTPFIVAVVGGTVLVIAVVLLLVSHRNRIDLDVRIWWTKRQLNKYPHDATGYDVALLVSGNEQFAFYLKDKLQRDFHLNVFSADDLDFGTAPISCLSEAAKRSRSVLVVITPEVYDDNEFVAIIGDIIADATPVFVVYRKEDSPFRDTDPPRLDRNIEGAMAVRPPLRWPGREAVPSSGPDSLEEGQIVEYWEESGLRQVRIFWKELQYSLLKMEKARVVSTVNVRRVDSVSGPLLSRTAVQSVQCPNYGSFQPSLNVPSTEPQC